MIERREQNYSHAPVYLTTFYREGVQLKNKFQNLSEAVFKVYKTSSHSVVPDQVKLLKMSRLSNVEAKDSLLVKVKSGIQVCIQMDIIKDFKVKRAKMLFGSRDLHIWFEMITCKVETGQVVAFPRTERLPTRTIFSDTSFKYDENFWKDFNVIPLEEEISKLIEKISLKIEKIGD